MVREEAVLRMRARSTGHTFVRPFVRTTMAEISKFYPKILQLLMHSNKNFLKNSKNRLFNFLKIFC